MIVFSFIIVGLYLAGATFCYFSVRNKPGVDKRLCLNPIKWGSYVLGTILIKLIPLHILEQLVIRIYDKECIECVHKGSCIDCGCDIPEKMYVPYETCSKGNWGAMILERDRYIKHREGFPISITVEHGVRGNKTSLNK